MRVLYFHRDDNVHDRRFLDALGRLPVEVIALRLEDRVKAEDAWNPRENIKQYTLIDAHQRFTWKMKTRVVHRLGEFAREHAIDVIHAGPVDLCAWLAASAGLHPLVSMSWGFDLLVNARRNLVQRRRSIFTLHRSEVLLADCEAVKDTASRFGFPPDRIVVFPWGVDLETYHPARSRDEAGLGRGVQEIALISTRSMERLYGCDVVINAFIICADRNPGLVLTMIGDGSQRDNLMRKIKQAGLEERVRFIGRLPEVQMPAHYQTSDVYISASHSDGTSVSLLQAMACGLAVIVSDIPGNREWVQSGLNGWVFKDGDSGQLADMILDAAQNVGKRRAFSLAARETVIRQADWQQNYPLLMDAYRMAIDRHANGGSF